MQKDWDVIVVGAGFAGATAARECAIRGLRTLVLEGRDRVGGRTWTSHLANGDVAELGGTYVHWLQPHTWSEISRYALEDDVVEAGGELLEWAAVPGGDGLKWLPADEHAEHERALYERVFGMSATALPNPYDPLREREAVARLDPLTVRERLDQLDLDPDDDAYLTALFSTETASPHGSGSFMSLLRWYAPAGHNYDAMMAAVFGYKMKRGIQSLLDALLADGGAELRLDAHVTAITTAGDAVTVRTAGGDAFTAAAVVLATPAGVWPHIAFDPPLSPRRLEAAGRLQANRVAKGIAIIRGESRRFIMTPHAGNPIGAMWTLSKRSDDEQMIVAFASPHMADADDHEAFTAAIVDLLPHVEVTELQTGTYYDDDPNSRGGWPMLGPGGLTELAPHETLASPEGRVAFATSDIAKLWSGFIDGAIESGMRAGRDAIAMVREPDVS